MNIGLPEPLTKPRSDSILKTQPDELQEEIVKESRTKSNKELADWLTTEKKIQTSASSVCRFLAWFKAYRQGDRNNGTNEAVKDLGQTPVDFVKETLLEQQNMVAWNQYQRIELKREELALKRRIFERETAEWAVATFTNPKLKSIAQNTKKSFLERVVEAKSLMFGEEEPKSVESPNGQPVESGKEESTKPASTVQPPESSILPSNPQPAPSDSQPAENLQTAAAPPALSPAAGSMSPTDAANFVGNLQAKVRRNGPSKIYQWDIAALTACLSGQPAEWYCTKIADLETMEPPSIDPRLDPESPWFHVWPKYVKGEIV